MFKKKIALKINTRVLGALAILDLIRGYMHTFNINWASANIAKIDPIPDSLMLMGSFGISNFLTGFIYLLIIWKAKQLAPYILLLIPFSYVLGIIGLKIQNVQMEAEFNGQYMMHVYLILCALTGVYYFVASNLNKDEN